MSNRSVILHKVCLLLYELAIRGNATVCTKLSIK